MNYKIVSILVVSLYCLVACEQKVSPLDEQIALLELQPLPEVSFINSQSTKLEQLGKTLFWDPILSGEKDIACASCHHPQFGYADGLDLSIGVGGIGLGTSRIETAIGRIPRIMRNSPTVLNTTYNGLLSLHQDYNSNHAPMFWDSRTRGLENQALGPLASYNEMRGNAYSEEDTYDSLVIRLKSIPTYISLFDRVFGHGENAITKVNIGKAIAAFERTLISSNSPYDLYVRGNHNALTAQQKLGVILFFGKGNCANCHSGPMFSDYNDYNLAIEENTKVGSDLGKNDTGKFRTPTLRNITLTAPYMHNGMHATLQDVMEYYNEGKSENPNIRVPDPKIKPLGLTQDEILALIAFMESLTDESFDKGIPSHVPSGLKPGGNI